MKFYLVRHGETEWNKLGKFQGHVDVKLTERGLAQARETAQAAAGWEHAVVYASPLTRTVQFAEEICRVTPVPLVTNPGFKELGLGDLEGVTGQEMRERWPEVYARWRSHPESVEMPNGESLGQVQDRAWQAISAIEESHEREESVLVVSHNFAIRTIVFALLGIPLANFHRMSLSLASLCTFETDERGRRLTGYNSTGHLSLDNR